MEWTALEPAEPRSIFEQAITKATATWTSGSAKALWAIRPALWRNRNGLSSPLRLPVARHTFRAAFRGSPLFFAASGQTLLAWSTENQRRALAVEAFEAVTVPVASRGALSGVAGSAIAAKREVAALRGALGEKDLSLDWSRVAYLFGRARLGAAIAAAVLRQTSPKVVVVATQHDPLIRALLQVAREAGIPSVYVPHAPAADNYEYADLPVDYAALRGPAEVDCYGVLGIDRSRTIDCGDPGLPAWADEQIDQPGRDVVFAVSPWSDDRWAWIWSTARDGLPADTVVARHPRSDLADLQREMASGWKLAGEPRTVETLRARGRVLVHSASGVALESMRLGLPTVDLRPPGERAHYHFLRHPSVDAASDASDLRQAVARLVETADDREERDRRIEWARAWSSEVGPTATQNLVRAVWSAKERGSAPMLIDRYGVLSN